MDAEVAIKDYSCHRADRVNRIRGGTSIYLHNSLTAESHFSFSNSYCEAVMIHIASCNMVIIGVYRPPLCPFDKFAECLEAANTFIEKIDHVPEIFIGGDFNLPFINWGTCSIDSGKSLLLSDRRSALQLFDFMESNFMEQLVLEPTRHDKNTLDLIFSNNPDCIHSLSVEKTEKSDHDLVQCRLLHPELLLPDSLPERPPHQPSSLLDDLNLNLANWEEINEDLMTVDWSPVLDDSSSQSKSWSHFEDIVADICSRHAPSHSARKQLSSKSPQIPKERRVILRRKRRLNARINAIKYTSNDMRLKPKLDKLQRERASLELLLKDKIKNERVLRELSAIGKIKLNPKAFYSYAKKSSTYKAPVGPLKDNIGTLQSDPKTVADILQHQYMKAFSDPSKADPEGMDIPTKTTENLNDINFSPEDVITAINEMHVSSAPGPDKFASIILKECKNSLALPIATLWRTSLDKGDIASSFKEQCITPIYKKGSKADAVNYRPVSLTSHLIKLFERILRKRIVHHLETHGLLSPNQHGFRKGRNCLTQLLHHIDEIMNDLDCDANADVIYLDFSKAFDKVDHAILLKKLKSYGITGKLYTWLESFLSDRQQFVSIEGIRSFCTLVLSGVPQGTVLGPLLFLIYIDDIVLVVKNSRIKIFADDSKLHKKITSLIDRLLLQRDLENVLRWAEVNNMELNQEKFQLLHHGKNGDLKQSYQLPSGVSIEASPSVKDLGLHIDEDLNWKAHITAKSAKANSMASWVLRTFLTREKDVMLLLYRSFVRTHAEYCCPLWSPHLIGEIIRVEAIQRTFTSKIKGFKSLNYWQRLQALSLYSLQRRRERYMIILVWKIYNNLIPNSVNLTFRESTRHGTMCIRPLGHSKKSSVNTMIFNSFPSTASALYNVVPPEVKAISTLIPFKRSLDHFLQSYPDTPPTPGYIAQNKNSMLEWAGSTSK